MNKQLKNRKRPFTLAALITAPLMLYGCYATTNLDNTDLVYVPDANVLAEGKTLYQAYCLDCHGSDMSGNGPKAGELDPKPANLNEKSLHFTQTAIKTVMDFPHYSQEAIKDKIKYGNNTMPPLKQVLSSKEIDNLTHYISNTIRSE